jgi:hypothetical protein
MVSTLTGQGPWERGALQILIIDCKAFGLECKCCRDRGRWEEKSADLVRTGCKEEKDFTTKAQRAQRRGRQKVKRKRQPPESQCGVLLAWFSVVFFVPFVPLW